MNKFMSRKLLAVIFSAAIGSSAFAIDGLMHDSVFIMTSKVKDFSDTGIRENVVNGRAVTTSPADLKVGDIFIDVNGHAKKVTKITKKGNNITIDTETPDFPEVFDGFEIPEQTADIKAVLDEKYGTVNDVSSSTVASREASDSDTYTTDYTDNPAVDDNGDFVFRKLLDVVMSTGKGYAKYSPTITFPVGKITDKDCYSSSLSEIDKTIKNLANEGATEDNKAAMEDAAKARQKVLDEKKKASESGTSSVSGSIKISPEFRYKSWQNKVKYAAQYAKAGIDTHGTWKVWKWTSYYEPGYVEYNLYNDQEFGGGFTISGNLTYSFSYPIPYLSYDPGQGVYVGLYFEASDNASLEFTWQQYQRQMHHIVAFSNFNMACIPSNSRAKDYSWTPSADQKTLCYNGTTSGGLALKAGIKLWGLELIQAKGTGSLVFTGSIGGAFTKVDEDADNRDKLVASLEGITDEGAETMKANIETEKQKLTWLKQIEGSQLYGNATLNFCAIVNVNLFDNLLSYDLFKYTVPIWSVVGDGKKKGVANYQSPFINGTWPN